MLRFIDFVYGKFGLKYEMFLSTRPEKYIGEIEMWDQAEAQVRSPRLFTFRIHQDGVASSSGQGHVRITM